MPTHGSVFQSVPVVVASTALTTALVSDVLVPAGVASRMPAIDALSLAQASSHCERTLDSLVECVDDLSAEQRQAQYFARVKGRLAAAREAWVSRRRADNAARRATGLEPLPMDEATMAAAIAAAMPGDAAAAAKPPPSALEAALLHEKIHLYCVDLDTFTSDTVEKIDALQRLIDGASLTTTTTTTTGVRAASTGANRAKS